MQIKLIIFLIFFSTNSCFEALTDKMISSAETCPSKYCGSCQDSVCSQCYDSIFYNGKCIPVQTKIEKCLYYVDPNNCLLCFPGFYPNDGKCITLDLKDCISSFDNINCRLCDGLIDGKKCTGQKCSIENCKSCKIENEKEVCDHCSAGYKLDLFFNTCKVIHELHHGCWLKKNKKCVSCFYLYYDTSNSSESVCKHTTIIGQIINFQSYSRMINSLMEPVSYTHLTLPTTPYV